MLKINEYLYNLSLYCHGNAIKMHDLLNKKTLLPDNQHLANFNEYILAGDNYYPHEYLSIPLKPLVLYYQGNIQLLKYATKISIIGSRKCSEYGKSACKILIEKLSIINNNLVIVSGLASGIDQESHKAALKYNLPTIAILGFSFDNLFKNTNYETQNLANLILKNNGLIITEYPNTNALIAKNNFKIRNRLIAGLSSKLIIIEAKTNSGTMNTVKHALEQNKEVFCLPGLPFSNSGCNYLIQEGANLLDNVNDLF